MKSGSCDVMVNAQNTNKRTPMVLSYVHRDSVLDCGHTSGAFREIWFPMPTVVNEWDYFHGFRWTYGLSPGA